MSSTRVRKLKQVVDFTAVWSANVLTVTTAAIVLVTGDVVTLVSSDSPQFLTGSVTVTNGTTFTMAAPKQYENFLIGKLTIDFFRTGFTGNVWFSAPISTGLPGVIQSVVTGTGGATTVINASLNGVNYGTALATLTNTTATGNSQNTTITANWPFLCASISVIGAATKLEIWHSA